MFSPEIVNREKNRMFKSLRQKEDVSGDDTGTVTVRGRRYNIMGTDYFMAEMLEMLEEVYGQGAAGIIENTGVEYGEDLLEDFDGESTDERMGELLGFLKFIGYAHVAVRTEELVFYSSPTAEEYGGDSERACYFLSGVLTGASRELYGESVNIEEKECKCENGEKCVFEVVSQ